MLRKFLVLLAAVPLVLSGVHSSSAASPLQITFESNDTTGFIHIDFDDSGVGQQASTVTSGVAGNSGKVLQVVRGVASWAGTTILKDDTKALVTADSKLVTAKIYAPVAGKKLLMKLEKITDVTQSVESYATEDTVVGWHEYTFDFAVQRPGTEAFSTNKTYNMASMFFDYTLTPNPSTSGLTYYLDDVTFASATAGTGGGSGSTITATPTLLSYEANDVLGALGVAEASPTHPQGIFGGGSAAIVADTVGLGAAGNKVLQLTKSGQPWTGYNAIVETDGTKRLTSAQFPNVTFKYFSPKANSPVAIQLFIGETMEVQMTQNASLGASSMKFDFSTAPTWSASKIYTKLVVFPDFQVPTTTPAGIYYFDEIAVNGAVTTGLPSKPANRVTPTVSGKTFKVGSTVSGSKGAWSGTGVIGLKFSWYRCSTAAKTYANSAPAKASKCALISGQKSATYKLTKADKGKYIRLLVTATNSLGSVAVLTKSTSKVG